MKKEKAEKLIKRFRQGDYFSRGHYSSGYEKIFYDPEKKKFIFQTKDIGLDMFNPTVKEASLTEKQLLKKLIEEFEYSDVANYLT